MLRAKWLTKLENNKDLEILTRFKEQYTKSCYNTAIKKILPYR